MQISAESRRVLLGPRRSAYIAYAEKYRKTYILISEAATQVNISMNKEGDAYQESLWLAEARLRDAATEEEQLEHQVAAVLIEGPKGVINACIDAGRALTHYRAEVFYAVDAMPSRAPLSEEIQKIEKKGSEADLRYLEFLYAASDSLGADLRAVGGSERRAPAQQ
jgi:hypothetical protein